MNYKETKDAIKYLKVCQELWEWMFSTNGSGHGDKNAWPGWKKYGEMEAACPCCDFAQRYPPRGRSDKDCTECLLIDLWPRGCQYGSSPYISFDRGRGTQSDALEIIEGCKNKIRELELKLLPECCECGNKCQQVEPGKYQCSHCEDKDKDHGLDLDLGPITVHSFDDPTRSGEHDYVVLPCSGKCENVEANVSIVSDLLSKQTDLKKQVSELEAEARDLKDKNQWFWRCKSLEIQNTELAAKEKGIYEESKSNRDFWYEINRELKEEIERLDDLLAHKIEVNEELQKDMSIREEANEELKKHNTELVDECEDSRAQIIGLKAKDAANIKIIAGMIKDKEELFKAAADAQVDWKKKVNELTSVVDLRDESCWYSRYCHIERKNKELEAENKKLSQQSDGDKLYYTNNAWHAQGSTSKGILEFIIPEDHDAFVDAVNVQNYKSSLFDIYTMLRGWHKYGHNFNEVDVALDAAWEQFFDILDNRDINIDMISS